MPSLIDRLRDSGVVRLGESEWRDIKNRCYVNDQLSENTENCSVKVVLLLESPHKDEVCSGHPLAGQSGIDVARKMIEWEILPSKFKTYPVSIGQLVHDKCRHVHWLGLMNVSELPLQDEAYNIRNCSPELELLLCRFGKIRTGVTKNNSLPHRHSPSTQKVQEIIVCDLADRINRLLERCASSPMFVPCGRFAKAALKEARNKIQTEICEISNIPPPGFIPHPSFHNWMKNGYKCPLAHLKSELSRLLSNPKNQRRKK